MKLCRRENWTPIATLAGIVLTCAPNLRAQSCPPVPPTDVLFEITLRTYDADWLSPAYNFVDTGPVYSSFSTSRLVGALPGERKETYISVVEQAPGSLAFSVTNSAGVLAKRVDGHSFGCGGRIVVDAYVRGPSGTPYYVTRNYSGLVEANFPQGLGRADAQFNGTYASSVNGQGPTASVPQASTFFTGSSGPERNFVLLPGGTVTFSHAGHYEYDISGIIHQSIDFCFFSCPTLEYWARGNVGGSMEVGIGHPPCTGTLEHGWCTACVPAGITGVNRKFAISADIQPVSPATSCTCCEYRQYIRKEANYRYVIVNGQQFPGWYPRRPNYADEGTHCDTWAEDSDTKGWYEISYGYRQPKWFLHQPYGAYVDVDRSTAQICASPGATAVSGGCHYESLDTPQMASSISGTIGSKKYIEFEGRLISKQACTPGASRDVVLARRRWTMCCESIGSGLVADCAEGGPPQYPPFVFSEVQQIGQRSAQLLLAKVNGRILAFAIVDVTPQTPLGMGAITLAVAGVNAVHADSGPFEAGNLEFGVADAYFPFLLNAGVSGSVTATVDIFGDQATWQVDLSSLGGAQAYCTPGTTSNGCTAVMAAVGAPSMSTSAGFTLVASGLEGQRSGLTFYGVSGRLATIWRPGSTSFLCVKPPTQRLLQGNSGGAAGSCNGTMTTDFLAFVAANPGSLGSPFASGAVCNAQTWFRDPPAPGTTHMSNAIEWTMLP